MGGIVGHRSTGGPEFDGLIQRAHPRLRVRVPARLISFDGFLPATLLNLSHSGARIRTFRPVTFREAALQWLDYEAFGQIVWQANDMFGFAFETRLPVRCLMDTRNVPAELAADLFPDEPEVPELPEQPARRVMRL